MKKKRSDKHPRQDKVEELSDMLAAMTKATVKVKNDWIS